VRRQPAVFPPPGAFPSAWTMVVISLGRRLRFGIAGGNHHTGNFDLVPNELLEFDVRPCHQHIRWCGRDRTLTVRAWSFSGRRLPCQNDVIEW
jgi:hypothetical protein